MAQGFASIARNIAGCADRLSRADIPFYLLPALMALLIAGTLAQRDMGLYGAHKMFFASFVFFVGPLPLPGGYSLIGLLGASLLLKFLLHSEWAPAKAGINLAHLGVLVLLLGGLLTALLARESYMIIAEGQQTPYIYDYQRRTLFVFKDDFLQREFDFAELKPGFEAPGLDLVLQIKESCANCAITKREAGAKTARGMAQFMQLGDTPPKKEPEENLSGVTFEITGLNAVQNGLYIAFEAMPKPIELQSGGHNYKIVFGKAQNMLPFSLRLDDFQRKTHPGTDQASAFSSDITIIDGGVEWPARIEMNKPLRYKGYTFFQSSFEQRPDGEASILSVVENRGRLFPYIGTALLAAGLILHLVITLRMRGGS